MTRTEGAAKMSRSSDVIAEVSTTTAAKREKLELVSEIIPQSGEPVKDIDPNYFVSLGWSAALSNLRSLVLMWVSDIANFGTYFIFCTI